MEYILSLDLSTKSSGWAIFNKETKELVDYGCITSASADVIKRIYIMRDGIKEVLNKYKISKIIAEEVRPDGRGYGVGNQHVQKVLTWLQAALEFMVHDDFNKIPIEYIYPSSWRATCGIKNGRGIRRETLKESDIRFVKEKYNINVNDDIADAIGIGHANVNPLKDNNELNWG